MGEPNYIKTRSQSLSSAEMTKNKHKSTDNTDSTMNLEDKLNKILLEVDVSNKGIQALNCKFDNLAADFNRVDKKTAENQKQIVQLNRRLDSMDQHFRRNNIRLFGIPEIDNEDTRELVSKLLTDKLNIEVDNNEIVSAYRVGKVAESATRSVFVRLLTYDAKNKIYNRKNRLRGTNIVIREDLTKERLQLLKVALEKFGRGKVWTFDGRIKWIQNGKVRSATQLEHLSLESESSSASVF